MCREWRRIGLDGSIAERFPDFARGVLDTHLYAYLAYFDHPLQYEEDTGEPALLVDGELVFAADLLRRFALSAQGVVERDTGRVFTYLEEGLTHWDRQQWPALRPLRVLPPDERPARHTLRVVMLEDQKHAWVQMIQPNGALTAFGFFTSYELGLSQLASAEQGFVCCPDLLELRGGKRLTADIELEPAMFHHVLTHVAAEAQHPQAFNTIRENCVAFVARTVALTGIDIATRTTLTRMLTPKPLERAYDRLPASVRRGVSVATDAAGALGANEVINTALLLLGASRGAGPGRALVRTPRDFIMRSQLQLASPGRLRHWMRAQNAAPRVAATSLDRHDLELAHASPGEHLDDVPTALAHEGVAER